MGTDPIIETLRAKRLVFTVATGRCGTAYLAELFKFLPGVHSDHEPPPEFADVMRHVQEHPPLAIQFLMEKKLPAIAAINAPIYVETSHLFCKGFLEPCLDLGLKPSLVALSRPPRQVALSMFKMGTIPGRTDKGLRFYLSPEDPGVLPVTDWKTLTDYQLCYWYCLEIARRADQYNELFARRGIPFVRVALDEITRYSGFVRVVRGLGLPFPNLRGWLQYLLYHRNRVNESRETKKAVSIPKNLDQLETDVRNRVG